jgi:hypothetical protein
MGQGSTRGAARAPLEKFGAMKNAPAAVAALAAKMLLAFIS